MKGKKRLEEIKERFRGVLEDVNPEDIEKYNVQYEPIEVSPRTIMGKKVPVPVRDSPAYQFFLVDKTQPGVTYPLMEVYWQDIAKPTLEHEKKYLGGSIWAPDIIKAIEALGKDRGTKEGREKNQGAWKIQ